MQTLPYVTQQIPNNILFRTKLQENIIKIAELFEANIIDELTLAELIKKAVEVQR